MPAIAVDARERVARPVVSPIRCAMPKPEALVQKLLRGLDQALVVGVIDLPSAMLLSVGTAPAWQRNDAGVLDRLAVTTRELFGAETETGVGRLSPREILVGSGDLWQYFARLPDSPSTVLVAVTRSAISAGLLMARCREVLGTGGGVASLDRTSRGRPGSRTRRESPKR